MFVNHIMILKNVDKRPIFLSLKNSKKKNEIQLYFLLFEYEAADFSYRGPKVFRRFYWAAYYEQKKDDIFGTHACARWFTPFSLFLLRDKHTIHVVPLLSTSFSSRLRFLSSLPAKECEREWW